MLLSTVFAFFLQVLPEKSDKNATGVFPLAGRDFLAERSGRGKGFGLLGKESPHKKAVFIGREDTSVSVLFRRNRKYGIERERLGRYFCGLGGNMIKFCENPIKNGKNTACALVFLLAMC